MGTIIQVNPMEIDPAALANASANPEVTRYVAGTINPHRGWTGHEPTTVDHDPNRVVPIAPLRRKIMKAPPLKAAMERTYEGIFFPALLLCSGWWERRSGSALAAATGWRDELQHWLFTGFEQWGPSWDVNANDSRPERYLFGQIGEGDEAESLTVIVAGSKADDIRAQLSSGSQTFRIRVTGTLCHRDHIGDIGLKHQIQQWGKSFEYCLIVYDEPNHRAEPLDPRREPPSLYSGYIWKCVMPRSLAKLQDAGSAAILQTPQLHEVYFLFEHTNLSSFDAIRFNLDSLRQKEEYLRREMGDLIVIQKSSELVEGQQALPTETFYKFITRE
jgi:hypothetical protein